MAKTINSKSCMLDATLFIITLPSNTRDQSPEAAERVYQNRLSEFLDFIGHDGSERGFHTQEIQDALFALRDVLVVRHELYPCIQLPGGKVVPIYPREGVEARFLDKLNRNDGILIVRKPSGIHHALGYQKNSNTAFDCATDTFINLENLDIVMFLEFVGA